MAYDGPYLQPLDWPSIRVDIDVGDARLEAMLTRVEEHFRFLGNEDPHWSVLTAEKFRKEQIGQNVEEFYLSGQEPVNNLLATLRRNGFDIRPGDTCMELGCGVARSSVWLSPLFRELTAVDISAPHLKLAAEAARAHHCTNIRFTQLDRISTLSSLGEFDFFFSVITLQHNPPPVIVQMLRRIFACIKPNGFVYFQVPTYRPGYAFDADAYLATPPELGNPEMHVVPQPVLHALLRQYQFQLVELREDGAAGGDNISSRFLARKLG